MKDLHTLLKDNIAVQQKQLYDAYVRIKELTDELNALKKQVANTQLEFDFNANI